MVEKYYVLECAQKASVYCSHAAVAMVTFQLLYKCHSKVKYNIVVKFLCVIFVTIMYVKKWLQFYSFQKAVYTFVYIFSTVGNRFRFAVKHHR